MHIPLCDNIGLRSKYDMMVTISDLRRESLQILEITLHWDQMANG